MKRAGPLTSAPQYKQRGWRREDAHVASVSQRTVAVPDDVRRRIIHPSASIAYPTNGGARSGEAHVQPPPPAPPAPSTGSGSPATAAASTEPALICASGARPP